MNNPRAGSLTGDAVVDRTVRGFLEVVALLFPERIRACYLTGSWSDGTAVRVPGESLNSSDVDLSVVFRGAAEAGERERFEACRRACEEISGLGLDGLDASALDETQLVQDGNVSVKEASLLLSGEDIRQAIPVPRLGDYTQRAITLSVTLIGTFRATTVLAPPLTYPDPVGEFYGYDFGEEEYGGLIGTRLLVDSVTWGATALVAIQAQRLGASKRAAVALYADIIGDEWTALIQGIYQRCKHEWRYGIPEASHDRQELRGLCSQVVAFENHLLDLYANYLHQARRTGEPRLRDAASEMLARITPLVALTENPFPATANADHPKRPNDKRISQ